MSEECRNIYKRARRNAGYTQEAAAEMLNVSVESLRAYETDRRIPAGDVVLQMMICYNCHQLPTQHLQETSALFNSVVPRLEERKNQLAGTLSGGEAIIADLRQIIQSGLELDVFCGDGSTYEGKGDDV